MTPTTLTFLGAAGTVTGSKTLVTGSRSQVLVDCGLFQGERELRQRNWDRLPVAASEIDVVALTHAHLDHCGYLPRLCDEGFTGKALATASTADLAQIVLLDSAHLLEEEARHAAEHGWSKHARPVPLYDQDAARRAIGRLVRVPFDRAQDLAPGAVATWHPAGHILGSATVTLAIDGKRILFTGDLGRPNHPLLKPPAPPEPVDVVVTESTYGDRHHHDPDLQHLADVITRTVHRGGSVLIPAFAVDRTEVLLCALHELSRAGSIPDVPIVLDSPMALHALEVYNKALAAESDDARPGAAEAFDPAEIRTLTTQQDSMSVNSPEYPTIIISASGMATGGRVLHHLRHQLPDPRNTVLLVGYQAFGTRGRTLLEGARAVKLFGQYVPVRAQVEGLEGSPCTPTRTSCSPGSAAWTARRRCASSPTGSRPPRHGCVTASATSSGGRRSCRALASGSWSRRRPAHRHQPCGGSVMSMVGVDPSPCSAR
jgi:metallo-beta-lactamase family protein